MLGPYGQLLNGSPRAIEKGIFAHNVMGAFQSGINHGSVQVMRDQVARRGLGLPSGRKARPGRPRSLRTARNSESRRGNRDHHGRAADR